MLSRCGIVVMRLLGRLPLAWVLMLSGAVPSAPTFATSALQWHAHEMFYGFGWALLGETPVRLAIAGGALCLAGVYVTRRA